MDAGFLDMLHDAGDDDVRRRREMASTSTSIASRRYWSISTGLSPDTCTAVTI